MKNPNSNPAPYFSLRIGTDLFPFETIGTRGKTIVEIRTLSSELDPSFKPIIEPGGFCGHCKNQDEQLWIYRSVPEAPTVDIRWSNAQKGWYDKHGNEYLPRTRPDRYRDYNF